VIPLQSGMSEGISRPFYIVDVLVDRRKAQFHGVDRRVGSTTVPPAQ